MAGGFFSSPSDKLDPALFDGDVLRPKVHQKILNLLYKGLQDIGLKNPHQWVHAWLTGSAASFQWGNGDLDILFAADLVDFLEANPQFPRLSVREVANYVDELLRTKVWPRTSSVNINGEVFEITFFWNALTGLDIRNIHPYAAYNLNNDDWDVRPPELPEDPHVLYPREWYDIADADARQAQAIDRMASQGPSGKLSAWSAARTMWESIHGGRHAAFSDTGRGYGDIHNFRWQAAKESGAVGILRRIVADADEYRASEQDRLYGTALPEPSDIITRAAMRYAKPNYYG
jgi:hypothetical protein